MTLFVFTYHVRQVSSSEQKGEEMERGKGGRGYEIIESVQNWTKASKQVNGTIHLKMRAPPYLYSSSDGTSLKLQNCSWHYLCLLTMRGTLPVVSGRGKKWREVVGGRREYENTESDQNWTKKIRQANVTVHLKMGVSKISLFIQFFRRH